MADAAKAARGAFSEIKDGAGSMGSAVSGSMGKSRQGVMLLGEEFGVHLPRGVTTFIASLGPVGAAMEAAFPFVAIGAGVLLLLQHLARMREAGHELTQDQVRFGTAAQNAFNMLDQKLLQAQIRADDLHNNHLGALQKQLQLIDKQSLGDLMHQFDELAKTADATLAKLKGHWYTFSSGAQGAKNALEDVRTGLDALMARGDTKGAADLLKGTREEAERVLALQMQAKNSGSYTSVVAGGTMSHEEQLKHEAAIGELKKQNIKYDDEAIAGQKTLLDALRSMDQLQTKTAAVAKQDRENAVTSYGNDGAARKAEGAKQAAEHQQRMGEMEVAAEREQANTLLSLKQASVVERLASDIHLEAEEYRIKQEGNAALLAALDKAGKDYQNQYKALQDKEQELTLQHENTVAALGAKAREDAYRQALQEMEENEREKIDATQQGSAARLAVIDAAIKNEAAANLQDTQHYRELLTQRVEEARRAAEEQAKLTAEAGKEEADNTLKMGELTLAAQKQHQELMDSARRVSVQQRVQEEIQASNQEKRPENGRDADGGGGPRQVR